MAGVTLGFVEERTAVLLKDRDSNRRVTRLESSYLRRLAAKLRLELPRSAQTEYVLNDTAYVHAKQLRYIELRADEAMPRFGRNAATLDEPLSRLIPVAREGATMRVLLQVLKDFDDRLEESEARDYIEELIRQQVLVPRLGPPIVGPEPLDGLMDALEEANADHAWRALDLARHAMKRLDAPGLQDGIRRYGDIASALAGVSEEPPTFQVDLLKPAETASLSKRVIDELLETAEFLRRVGSVRERSLDEFCKRFRRQYENAWMPLLEVLDEECGIGFDPTALVSATTPLLDGIDLRGSRTPERRLTAFEQLMLRKLEGAIACGDHTIRLESRDWPMKLDSHESWPEGLSVVAKVIAASEEAVTCGDFKIMFNGAMGPTAASMLSRFCHLDSDLEQHVRRAVEMEEGLVGPETICAELVHDPGGRGSNIVHRPEFRSFEIPYWGDGAKRKAQVIRAEDIWIGVSSDHRITLFSSQHKRTVQPRLTNAHNYFRSPLSAYRFLATLQHCREGTFTFRWGQTLEELAFLPRVEHGKCILAYARWRLESAQLHPGVREVPAKRFARVQSLRSRYGLPRFVTSAAKGSWVLVDLDNPLSADVLMDHARAETYLVLSEFPEATDSRWINSQDGYFCHELVIPLRRAQARAQRLQEVRQQNVIRPVRYHPGTEWLFAKIYTEEGERLLRERIRPLIEVLTRHNWIRQWFFLRYADPEAHLRLRFRGSPDTLITTVLPQLVEQLQDLLDDQTVWRLQLDTYTPEVDRYGGLEAMEFAEQMFQADSAAVLDIVTCAGKNQLVDDRWKIALYGVHRLLSDFQLGARDRLTMLQDASQSFWVENHMGAKETHQTTARFREHRAQLEALVGDEHLAAAQSDFGPAVAEALETRSRSHQLAVQGLHRLAATHRLTRPSRQIILSHTHMFTNRLLRSRAVPQEAVIYDFLARLYRGLEERKRS
jgi:thiopeptide-type bacteriocin biosynthesis protein